MPARKRRSPGKAGYHHGDLRRALVEAAEQLLESRGPAQLTLRETARLVGVSAAAPYRHFADKDALVAAVLAQGFGRLAEALGGAARAQADSLTGLEALAAAYLRFALRYPSTYRLMFGATVDKNTHPELRVAGDAALGELVAGVERCQEAGLVVQGDPRELALAGWSMCHGLASLQVDGALEQALPVDLEATGGRLVKMLLRGMRPEPRRAPRR